MKLQKRILALAVASALVAPNALAVQGSDGMHYTSASEGFYASIRAKYTSGTTDTANPGFTQDNGTRLGIQGTGEMSHGLEGFYRYEAGIRTDSRSWDDGGSRDEDANSGIRTRLAYVGLRGTFGDATFGTLWGNPYNWVGATTDLPNAGGGNFTFGGFRKSRSVQYNSPDFNGLQVSGTFVLDGGSDTAGAVSGSMANADFEALEGDIADADLDEWSLSAKYGFQGFNVAGTYITTPDKANAVTPGSGDAYTVAAEDGSAWALAAGYSQDNWNVNMWYGQDNNSDFTTNGVKNKDDTTSFSIAGTVDIGKTTVVVLHETQEISSGETTNDNSVSVFDIQYKLNSKAKVWIGYVAQDFDSNKAKDDYVNIGLRHDF